MWSGVRERRSWYSEDVNGVSPLFRVLGVCVFLLTGCTAEKTPERDALVEAYLQCAGLNSLSRQMSEGISHGFMAKALKGRTSQEARRILQVAHSPNLTAKYLSQAAYEEGEWEAMRAHVEFCKTPPGQALQGFLSDWPLFNEEVMSELSEQGRDHDLLIEMGKVYVDTLPEALGYHRLRNMHFATSLAQSDPSRGLLFGSRGESERFAHAAPIPPDSYARYAAAMSMHGQRAHLTLAGLEVFHDFMVSRNCRESLELRQVLEAEALDGLFDRMIETREGGQP